MPPDGQVPEGLVDLIADRLRLVAEPTRIRLLDQLRSSEATVADLTAALGLTQQNVSKHLRQLSRAGIVTRRKEGTFSWYGIADERSLRIIEATGVSLTERVGELARRIRAAPLAPDARGRAGGRVPGVGNGPAATPITPARARAAAGAASVPPARAGHARPRVVPPATQSAAASRGARSPARSSDR